MLPVCSKPTEPPSHRGATNPAVRNNSRKLMPGESRETKAREFGENTAFTMSEHRVKSSTAVEEPGINFAMFRSERLRKLHGGVAQIALALLVVILFVWAFGIR